MPTFCRHSRLIQNCPICAREQSIELRPVVTSSAPAASQPRPHEPSRTRSQRTATAGSRGGSSVTVKRLGRGVDDGYRSSLAAGLRSSTEALRLAEELAFATTRISALSADPPGVYAEIADSGRDVEERAWLAFLTAYLCPLEGADPFSGVAAARTSWGSGADPALDGIATGPRTARDPSRGARTPEAYRAWAGRAGSQAAAFTGDPSWTPERRFARAFERLALPGLHRDARFDLLVTLGRLGVFELEPAALALGGPGEVTVAAKRALGIGDSMLLERRARDLAEACGIPLAALDLGLYNWERRERAHLGLQPDAEPDADALVRATEALGLDE